MLDGTDGVTTGRNLLYNLSTRMIAMFARLALNPRVRIGIRNPNGTNKSERHFFDFIVNGQSLLESVGTSLDLVSVLCSEYALDESIRSVNRLLLTEGADFPNNRRSLFICSECGDIECGAITAVVVREGAAIIWRDFGYENNYEENVEFGDRKAIGPFMFDVASYESLLLQAIDSLRAIKLSAPPAK